MKISAPTMEMTSLYQRFPLCRARGQVRHLPPAAGRLFRETLKDVSLRVSEIPGAMDAFNVAGRGEMSLSILIETMRREGYEFQVSPPRVLYETIDGRSASPLSAWWWMCPASPWAQSLKIGARKGDMVGDDSCGKPHEGGISGAGPGPVWLPQ